MYKTAERKAKSENESGKARRFGRGVKTLEHLLATSKTGEEIDQSEIPPELPPSATGAAPPKQPDGKYCLSKNKILLFINSISS